MIFTGPLGRTVRTELSSVNEVILYFIFRRGNPLYLCDERYQRLQKVWKQHGIAGEIVRHLETNRHLMQVDWTNY
jgi:hypothetical protein